MKREPQEPMQVRNPVRTRASQEPEKIGARPGHREEDPPSIPSKAQPSYEELAHFFSDSPDLLCIADFSGGFIHLNPAWHPTLGWTREELQSKPFLNFVHPADRPATRAEMAKLDAGGPIITFENRYHCKDGSFRWLQWTARPVPGRQEVYAIARDITRRKHMELQVLETLDLERERMGRELHDGLCQDLAGIASLGASLARRLDSRSNAESAAAREIVNLLAQTIRHARDLARGHDPLRLETIGLIPALADFCSNTEALFQVSCSLHGSACPPELGPGREAHLYRIAQEAVRNAITHGQASVIEIHLSHQPGGGTLTILDNGSGMSVPPDAARSGSGLHSMAYRASLLGGSLEILPTPTTGTTITCLFPLASPIPQP